ncbi:MAG: hypothetical protein LBQ20_12355 [Rhodanobacter sp.]|nr:hypothetical protein [Rhodanobacter sp.]
MVLALGWSVHAESAEHVVPFVSAPSVGTLECPNQVIRPKPQTPPPPREAPPVDAQIPTIAELGPLAQTVIREQPSIDPQTIPAMALRNPEQPRHIAIWGDSHIAAGPFMPTLLEALRMDGITIGAYYLPPTMGRANVHLPQLRTACVGPGWNTELSYTSAPSLTSGPALANRTAVAGPDSYLWLDLRSTSSRSAIRQLRIVYRASVHSVLDLSVNDGDESHIPLEASSDSQALTLRGDASISTIKLRLTQGSVTLYGFVLDYVNQPALTFDVFGLPSATIRGWANADPDYLRRSLQGVNYDGVILEYGTNEGNDLHFDRGRYASTLTQALSNLRRVFPYASCVLIGPPDRGVLRDRGASRNLLMFGRIHQQIEVTQREVGRHFGCVTWNWQDLMGGPGGSYGWFYASPSLMGHDLTHLSSDGYKQTGRALARSLGWWR